MKNLRELCATHDLESFRAMCGDPAKLNRLVHEMERLDGPVPQDEAILAVWGQPMDDRHRRLFLHSDNDLSAAVRDYRRPIENLCSPSVPLDRLMSVVQAARKWTGMSWLLLAVEHHHQTCTLAYLQDSGMDPNPVLLAFGIEMRAADVSPAEAIILACIAACIVYGEAR